MSEFLDAINAGRRLDLCDRLRSALINRSCVG
jgi:hypothetical protein